MAQTIDFSQIKTISHSGIDISKLILNDTRIWERYEIDEVYEEWVEDGYEGKKINSLGGWLYSEGGSEWLIDNFGNENIRLNGVLVTGVNTSRVNGEYLASAHGFLFKRGDFQRYTSSFDYYDLRKVVVSNQWIDTSHNVEKTRKKTMYYY